MPLDAEGREHDRLGRLVPHRLSWVALSRAVPGLLARFKPVPVDYWQRGVDHAVIRCPCGEQPCVGEGQSVQCQCDRIYLLADIPHVANSPRSVAGAAVD